MKSKYSLFVLTVATIFLTSCNSCNKQKVTLTVLGENSSNLQAMEPLKGGYEKNSNVKIEFKPNTFEDAFSKANQDFANKTGLYDIVLQYNFSLSSFVRNSYVFNIDEIYISLTTLSGHDLSPQDPTNPKTSPALASSL